MKECSVKMEPAVSEIQVDSKDEKRRAEASPPKEKQEGKTSRLCFKRRKKVAQAQKLKASSEAAEVAGKRPPDAAAPDQPQRPGGTWASIKHLVTRRKRSASSKTQKSLETEVQADTEAKDVDISKKKAKSRLRIPCIRFSRGARRSHHSKITDDSDSNIQVQAEAEGLEIQTQTQPNEQAIKAKLTPNIGEGASQKDGEVVCESLASNSVTSGENVISVELGLQNKCAIQTGAVALEKETEETEEKQTIQPQPASPIKSPETDNQRPEALDVLSTPAISDQHSVVEESSKTVLESGPDCKEVENRASAAEEDKPEETELNQTEKIELKQAEDIELNQAEEIELKQPEDIELKQAEEIELKQPEDNGLNQQEEIELKQAEEIGLKQAEETEPKQAEEIELNQAEEIEVKQVEDIELKQAEEIELNQAEEIEVKQAEDIELKQAEETELNQAEKIELNQAEEIELNQPEEIELNQPEEIEVKQAEGMELKQAEEIEVKQAEGMELKQAEEMEVKQTEDMELKQAEEMEVKQTEDMELKQAEEIEVKQTEDMELKQAEATELNQAEKIELNQAEDIEMNQAEETELSQTTDLKESGINAEKPKSEECRRMEPIAIIITDTEISEFDVKKSKNVPKQFFISMENEQVGVFANDSDFEGRTSEQYETLLIETASSLVKNAIQLSVEQLVNEMVSEDNKVNAVLQ
uniref:A-kinase anchor protein 5 n=1 Tax=Jaculus jaculus TaxID=51337 RepID=UPI001E1B441F|nr:A-kinase anchor protein 5 [Jaculus jaculus]XP_045010374.1 A-kinase anchor protein 5 [Jaculus jaculus]XP_045010375.1 A-kinase anchor protein 5 [Jaculus jaculus]